LDASEKQKLKDMSAKIKENKKIEQKFNVTMYLTESELDNIISYLEGL